MMKEFTGQGFLSVFDEDSAATFANLSFDSCEFKNCVLSQTQRLDRRSHLRNVRVSAATAIGCSVGPAVLEDVVLDGLIVSDLLIVWGAFFRRVRLQGRVGSIKVNSYPDFDETDPTLAKPFDAARADFYAATDWALDISEALFREFDLSGVPARLVRRDPKTQVVVRREKAESFRWQDKVVSWNTFWPTVVELALEENDPDFVLVAPRAASKKKLLKLVDGLENLRDIGLADPD